MSGKPPGQSLNNATDKEHLESSGKKWYEDGPDHENHAANHGLLVPNPFGDVPINDEAQNASDLVPVSCYSSNTFARGSPTCVPFKMIVCHRDETIMLPSASTSLPNLFLQGVKAKNLFIRLVL
jgi:hypothetical protein